MLYELPWNDEVMGKIVKYETGPFDYSEYGYPAEEALYLEGGGYVKWYSDKGRVMGSNCGVRTFGQIYMRASPGWHLSVDIKSRIFGIIGWLPMATNAYNFPYAKFTSMADGGMFSVAGKDGLKEVKKWGWRGRKIKAAAHFARETYNIYYLWRFLDQDDVYVLRGLDKAQTERHQEIVKFREWVDSISKGNKINWGYPDR